MVIDINRCNGCYNCFLACRDEYCGNDYPPHSLAQPMAGQFWMRVVERERGKYPKVKVAYIPIPCMHCDEASCVKAASDGAIYRRRDGIVLIDPEKATGRKELISSCPYRVIYWNEEKQVPQKCTLCVHLLDVGWREPRCVEACPTAALSFGDLDDPESEPARRLAAGKAERLRPEYEMKEKVNYIGLPKRFVAGSVVFRDIDVCAENVIVTLSGDGERKTGKTDNYGDFEFEDLLEDREYTITIEYPGYKPHQVKARTKTDVYLGDILLGPQ
jgi:Fe-S-cluster-containing dehydrogenase component